MPRTAPLLPLFLTLAACASPPSGPAPTDPEPGDDAVSVRMLASHGWHLAEATDASGSRVDALFPDPATPMRLEFGEDRLAVSGGCNRLSAAYTLVDGTLRVGPVAQTKMFCGGGALMAADEAMVARLSRPLAASLRGDRLVLSGADGGRLVLDGDAATD